LTEAVVQADTVLVLARLARLESDAGRDAKAKEYEDRAVRTCREIPWKTCDAQTILQLSERMERGDPSKIEP